MRMAANSSASDPTTVDTPGTARPSPPNGLDDDDRSTRPDACVMNMNDIVSGAKRSAGKQAGHFEHSMDEEGKG